LRRLSVLNAIELQEIDRQQDHVQEHDGIDVREQAVGAEQDVACQRDIRSDPIVVMQKLARTASDAQKPSPSTHDMIASS
jgi:hypothetical protein